MQSDRMTAKMASLKNLTGRQLEKMLANPNGPETWSGRGRTPVWVVTICQHENIDLDRFKADPRFAFQG